MNAFVTLGCPICRYMRRNTPAIEGQFASVSTMCSTTEELSVEDLIDDSGRAARAALTPAEKDELIDRLYRDLATARGEACQAKFYRAKWQSADKDLSATRARLAEMERGAVRTEATLERLTARPEKRSA